MDILSLVSSFLGPASETATACVLELAYQALSLVAEHADDCFDCLAMLASNRAFYAGVAALIESPPQPPSSGAKQ
jgi:hypothetical protein